MRLKFELARTIWQTSRGEDLAIDDRRRQADEAIAYFEEGLVRCRGRYSHSTCCH